MPTKLEEIIIATRQRVAAAKAAADVTELQSRAGGQQSPALGDCGIPTRGFRRRLQQVSQSGPAIIAELKKASPSRGLIRADFNVAGLAAELEQAGAAALSVLTDERFFQGSLDNLRLASQATHIPCLRKDFILDEFQLLEARAYGADAILLIVAALTQDELVALHRRARERDQARAGDGDRDEDLQLDVLCEVHDAAELDRALEAGCDMIGVNSRNLHTFQVDLNTSLQLAKRIPAGVVKVAESGIESAADIARLRDAGFDAFLIGETLMRAPNSGEALRALLAPNVGG